MKHEDWLSRWDEDRIVFHQDEVNPLLVRFAAHLTGEAGPVRVLVPLCGKSIDMAWLARQGHEVVGVELADKALRAFYEENGIAFEVADEPPFRVFRGTGVTTYAGDFLAADVGRLGTFAAAYDRAALIALPADMRQAYVDQLLSLLAGGGRVLLIALDYDAAEMDGPPFAVPALLVNKLFAGAAGVELLHEEDALGESGPLSDAGLSRLTRAVYLVTK